ncbi:hypothetical protein [Nocardia nova]|uniref:hypothetical protein n=1 Tax=Nocardia nova TaxID=37330 RepID=UPI00340C1F09
MSGKAQAEAPLLAWPGEWGPQRPPVWMILGIILFGLAAVVMVPYTIDAVSHDDSLRAAYGLVGVLLGISFVAVLLPGLRVRRKQLPDGVTAGHRQDSSPGLRILFANNYTVVLWLIVAVVFLVLRGIAFLAHLSDSDGSEHSAGIGGIIVVVIAVALAAFMISYLVRGRRRRGSVLIDPDGLSLSFGSSARTISWTEIGNVSPCIVNNSRAVRINPTPGQRIQVNESRSLLDKMQRGFYEENMDLHAHALRIDPPLLLHLVHYYWLHPEARDELNSEAAVDRMRRGELLG